MMRADALLRVPTPQQMQGLPADTDSRIEAELRQERLQAESLQQTFGLKEQEMPIEDFSCALQKTILMHGRMFISPEHVCFSSSVFGVKTMLVLAFRDVLSMSKGMHGLINPSIIVATASEEHVFASFFFRDHTYSILREVWKIQRRILEREAPPPLSPPLDGSDGSASMPAIDLHAAAAIGSSPARATAAPHASATPSATAAPANALPDAPDTPATKATQPAASTGAASPAAGTTAAVTATALPHAVSLGDDTLDCSPAEAEAALLADGRPFLQEFKTAQGASKVSVGAWTAVAGAGGKVREVRLVQAVKSKLSPVRETRVQETQQTTTLPDGTLVVQTHQVMLDAPYGDYFVVLSKWVFGAPRGGGGGCSIAVSAEVAFHKDTWFKGQIQANAIDEVRGNYKVFLPTPQLDELRAEVARLTLAHEQLQAQVATLQKGG